MQDTQIEIGPTDDTPEPRCDLLKLICIIGLAECGIVLLLAAFFFIPLLINILLNKTASNSDFG